MSECGKCVSGRFARRSVRPDQVDSPETICRCLSLEKGNMHGKTVTAHVESKGN